MKDSNDQKYDLAGKVIGLAMSVHRELGPGFLESVYESALCLELESAQLEFERQKQLEVFYKGQLVGHYLADVVVNAELIIELKAVQNLAVVHEVQLVNYLTATQIDHGLLLNFGSKSLQFKKKHRQFQPNPN
ncbi:GxxExxY protein [Roseibacillus persicicus]|uniref:GxxExxY protein n=1 Tax=Roseibacillus persicicus TaxID=454148 RepID=UPI00280F4610|nr:GxxExxY protein [Roseibacillus persicicus]MDQ8188770.1 GxxExxY protein [Roseibacillus persicicus]